MVLTVLLIAVVEIVLTTIIKKATGDTGLTYFVGGGYSFFVGEMLKHFTDERELEVVGIILVFAGIVQMAWAFFGVFAQIRDSFAESGEESQDTRQEAKAGTKVDEKQIVCPRCGITQHASRKKCCQCGLEFVLEDSSQGWKCPFCDHVNPETADNCENCGVDGKTSKFVGE